MWWKNLEYTIKTHENFLLELSRVVNLYFFKIRHVEKLSLQNLILNLFSRFPLIDDFFSGLFIFVGYLLSRVAFGLALLKDSYKSLWPEKNSRYIKSFVLIVISLLVCYWYPSRKESTISISCDSN